MPLFNKVILHFTILALFYPLNFIYFRLKYFSSFQTFDKNSPLAQKFWECFAFEFLTFCLFFVWPWNWQEFKVWESSHAKSVRSSESSDHLWSYPPHQFFLSANVKRARQSNYVARALWGSSLSLVQPRPSVEIYRKWMMLRILSTSSVYNWLSAWAIDRLENGKFTQISK